MQRLPRERLFDLILRIRRAEQELPDNGDLVAVRTELERQMGPSVPRSLAARVLGVSHTALKRWIDTGDVPTVFTPAGRIEVPLGALVDLHALVERQRAAGRTHVLEPIAQAGRRRAAALDVDELVGDGTAEGHGLAELRSLAYHRALAPRLGRPQVVEALHRVWQWRDAGQLDPRYADEWEAVLRLGLRELRAVLVEETPRGRALRQSSPFPGALSEPERHRILQAIG